MALEETTVAPVAESSQVPPAQPAESTSAVPPESTPVPAEGGAVEQQTPATEAPTQEQQRQYFMPGQQGAAQTDSGELEWVRQQYTSALNELARHREAQERAELEAVPEEQREIYLLRKKVEAMEQAQQQEAQVQVVAQWQNYCAQFVPADAVAPMQQMDDPMKMIHHSFTAQAGQNEKLQARINQLEAEVNALKGVETQPKGGPPITTSSGGATTIRSLRNMTEAEFRELNRRAMAGLLKDGDIPPL